MFQLGRLKKAHLIDDLPTLLVILWLMISIEDVSCFLCSSQFYSPMFTQQQYTVHPC